MEDEVGELFADDVDEVLGFPGLGEVVVEAAGVDGADGVLVVGLAGDEDLADGRVSGSRLEFGEEIDAGGAGEAVVAEDQADYVAVGCDRGDELPGVLDILGDLDAELVFELPGRG